MAIHHASSGELINIRRLHGGIKIAPTMALFKSSHLEVSRTVLRASKATALGYEQLIEWVRGFGRFTRAGLEGTGTYGAALARRVQEHGVQVRDSPLRQRSHINAF